MVGNKFVRHPGSNRFDVKSFDRSFFVAVVQRAIIPPLGRLDAAPAVGTKEGPVSVNTMSNLLDECPLSGTKVLRLAGRHGLQAKNDACQS